MKAAFLDRDGTIISDYADEQWAFVKFPQFLPRAIEALKEQRKLNYELIIITNQYLIGEGFITQQQYDDFANHFVQELRNHGVELKDVFYCPHRRDQGCRCCKPRPGMIEDALQKYPSIDLSKSFLVGDRPSDIALADAVGLKSFGIGFDVTSSSATRVETLYDILKILRS